MPVRFVRTSIVVLLVGLAGCATSPSATRTGEYLDDSWITARAKTALIAAEGIGGARIHVATTGGVVQLSGFSTSQKEIDNAVRAVQQIPGVKAVRNDIRLRAPLR